MIHQHLLPRRLYYGNPVNPTAPLNRGRIIWFLNLPKNRGSSRFHDFYGLQASLFNGASWSGLSRPSGHGSLSFDGTNDYALYPATGGRVLVDGLTEMSAAVSFRTEVGQASTALVSIPETSAGSTGVLIYCVSTSSIGIYIQATGSDAVLATSGVTYQDGNWHRLLMTYSVMGNFCRLYYDGILHTQTPGLSSIDIDAASNELNIGRFGTLGWHFNGQLDDVCVWNRGLSNSEAWQDYRASTTGYKRELNWLPDVMWAQAPAAPAGRIGDLLLLGVGA